MKPIAIFLLFIGTILILQGYYSQGSECPEPKTVIKYIPRSLYEDQLSDNQNLEIFYKSMFEDVTPTH